MADVHFTRARVSLSGDISRSLPGRQVVGDLPARILSAGEHRIRLVGTRSPEGSTAASSGGIHLTQEALDEIARLVLGTDATTTVVA
jgi:hypothetical protein